MKVSSFDVFLRQCEARKVDVAADFSHNIPAMPEAAVLRDHLFERQVLNYSYGIRHGHEFSIRRSNDSK